MKIDDGSERKKRIVIDLDVLTVAFWYKKDERKRLANMFLRRVESKEFEAETPFFLLEHLSKWNFLELKGEVEDFYVKNTKLITNNDMDKQIAKLKTDDKRVIRDLLKSGVKEEDAVLVIFTSIFDLDFLVTFNRKHLKSKEKQIIEVLKNYGLKEIRIALPGEI